MPIPPFNATGLLPIGIHDATVEEVRKRFGVIVAERDSGVYKAYIEFFSLVRESPGERKGILRIVL